MQKLYHRAPVALSFFSRHKKLVIAGILIVFFLIYLGPLLPYLAKTLHFTKEFVVPSQTVRSDNGRTNILLLGLDGRDNEPSGLTDTILFASINPSQNKALLLSLPRDLWIAEMKAKINTAFYYGNQQDGIGIDWSKRFVEEIVGQPVHYSVVVSFNGFVKLIDLLGGVDIEVDRSFEDSQYPIPGREDDLCLGDPKTKCRYETLAFNKGLQHMDGTTALKFARSRHAQGEEGTDFARSQRQQKIILAVRQKVFSTDVLLNPKKASQILAAIEGTVETDIPESQYAALAKLALSAKSTQVTSELLEFISGKSSLLLNPPLSAEYQKQFVLIPKDPTWGEIHNWVNCLLTESSCPIDNFTK